jgi:hypothetical protein
MVEMVEIMTHLFVWIFVDLFLTGKNNKNSNPGIVRERLLSAFQRYPGCHVLVKEAWLTIS